MRPARTQRRIVAFDTPKCSAMVVSSTKSWLVVSLHSTRHLNQFDSALPSKGRRAATDSCHCGVTHGTAGTRTATLPTPVGVGVSSSTLSTMRAICGFVKSWRPVFLDAQGCGPLLGVAQEPLVSARRVEKAAPGSRFLDQIVGRDSGRGIRSYESIKQRTHLSSRLTRAVCTTSRTSGPLARPSTP